MVFVGIIKRHTMEMYGRVEVCFMYFQSLHYRDMNGKFKTPTALPLLPKTQELE
jgi:hypothetical protein